MIAKILHTFSAGEFATFLAETGPGTNSRKITTLIRKDAAIEKDEIFKRVFKKKRNQQNDILLRNEMSILKRKLENFIISNAVVDISVHASYFKSYVMAQWCLSKLLVDDAEKYLVVAEKRAMEKEAWYGLLQINKLRLQASQYGKSDYQDKLKLMLSLADNHKTFTAELVANEIRYADFIKAGAFKLAVSLRKTTVPYSNTEIFSIELEKVKSKIAKYYENKSLAYSNSGADAIEFLKKCLIILEGEIDLPNLHAEQLTCLSALAMEYSFMGEWKKSIRMFDTLILHQGFDQFPSRNAVLLNYSTTLIKLKEYKRALEIIERLEQLVVEPIVLERIFTMKTNCYIFMEDVKGIKGILPRNLQSYDLSVRIYYRFLYVIYYLIKADYELAERELTNMVNMRNFSTTMYGPLANLFIRYIGAMNASMFKDKDVKRKLFDLKAASNDLRQHHPNIIQLIPGTWILEKAAELNGN